LTEAAQDMLARWRLRIFMIALVPFAVVGVYGARIAFFASPLWYDLTPWISGGFGALTTLLFFKTVLRGRVRFQAYERAMWNGALLVYLPPVICISLSWCILARALPDIYTRLAGESVEVITVLDKKFVRMGRYSTISRLLGACDERTIGTPFDKGSMRHYYCATDLEWRAVKEFTPVKIIERVSFFGAHIEHIESVATEYNP
jgi:hypothetical protein